MDCFRIVISELSIIHKKIFYINNLEITYELGITPVFCHGTHIMVFEKKKIRDIVWLLDGFLILYRLPEIPTTTNDTSSKYLLENFIILRIVNPFQYGINFIGKSFLMELYEITEKTYTFIRINIKHIDKPTETNN